jgi:uncharacterized protein (DUF2235 family)
MSSKKNPGPSDAVSGMPKSIVVLVDGTSNSDSDAAEDGSDVTNVIRLRDSLVKDDRQIVHYIAGVGTSGVTTFDWAAGATGAGADKRTEEALKFIERNYSVGSSIYLFGFSRGAAICRDIANHVDHHSKVLQSPVIGLLGLWDTVGAFGIPINIGSMGLQQTNLGKELSIPSIVKSTVHLLAIDEAREAYEPTLVDYGPGVDEVWFPGVHKDVGGGFKEHALADVTLRYMMERAKKAGLRLHDEPFIGNLATTNSHGKIHKNDTKLDTRPRVIEVRENGGPSTKLPRIHRSVERRMAAMSYLPESLKRLNGKYVFVD